jgi:hypothetical protein
MEKHQVTHEDQWRGNRNEPDDEVAGISTEEAINEKAINKVIAERRRADYLRLHDDDEAELELPR